MATAKTSKAFAWDTEVMVKAIEVNEFEKRVISITSLNGKEFVVIATHKKIKGEWKPVKNATVPKELWSDIADAVSDYDLKNAFGSTTNLTAGPKVKEPKAKAAPKAKKEPVASLQGVKTSDADKLARNENWVKLLPSKKVKAIVDVQKEYIDNGMVTIGITGTNYMVVSGMNQQQAEKKIKETKGFSRAKFTFFA